MALSWRVWYVRSLAAASSVGHGAAAGAARRARVRSARSAHLSQLAGQVSGGENQLVKGQTATIGGRLALELKDTKQAGSAYVTISASPEFLQTGDTGGHVDFTDYNAPLALTAPSASQTVAGSKYGL